ncbi:alpha/beta hydrolase [Microbacterium aurugineum]|uniref:Alpha/beta hydrolase n=1 Tax=Microbacterium aurugineum TaxID=2851642 RepID=A0ABY4J3T6_9MICO|nr:alpha/beta hydrolase [Microbacterium aurugineum]UPL18641.1 alpha/beta hydrolase [Microbacterium aurugineum]
MRNTGVERATVSVNERSGGEGIMVDGGAWRSRRTVGVRVLTDSDREAGEVLLALARAVQPAFESDAIYVRGLDGLPFILWSSRSTLSIESEGALYVLHGEEVPFAVEGDSDARLRNSAEVGLVLVDPRDGATSRTLNAMDRAWQTGVGHIVVAVVAVGDPDIDELIEMSVAEQLTRPGIDRDLYSVVRADPRDQRSMEGVVAAVTSAADMSDAPNPSSTLMVVAGLEIQADTVTAYGFLLAEAHAGMSVDVFGTGDRLICDIADVERPSRRIGRRDYAALSLRGAQAQGIKVGDVIALAGTLTRSTMFTATLRVPDLDQAWWLELGATDRTMRFAFDGGPVQGRVVGVDETIGVIGSTPVVTVALDAPVPLRVGTGFALEVDGQTAALGTVGASLASIDDDAKVVTVWFGTNRLPREGGAHIGFHHAPGGNQLHYGACVIRVPSSHRFGSTGTSAWKRMWKPGVQDGRLSLEEIRPNDTVNEFAIALRRALDHEKAESRALVYVHGYNTTFEEAAIRAGQLDADLNLPGITAFFSWPSHAAYLRYPADGDRARESKQSFVEFLDTLVAKAGVERVDLIVHSMGNQLLTEAVEAMVSTVRFAHIRFGVVALAAPDVSKARFEQTAPSIVPISKKATMYVSERDRALWLAQQLLAGPRAGSCPPLTLVQGIDAIDATDVDFSFLGHEYYAGSHPVLYDIWATMGGFHSPSQRMRLTQHGLPQGGIYWKLQG